MPREKKLIARNKKARHDYFIDEVFEAGIELTGTEVKSLRERGTTLRDCFATIKRGEAWLHNVHISPYSHGNRANVDPDRTRRLLLHKKEIRYLQGKTQERGFTLVPLSMYFNESNLAKVELGLAHGKKQHDKRADIAKRDHDRDVERALKDRTQGR
jgi:SsrA-binding protein